MPDLVKALHCGRVLLMDGAMGTELLRAGVPPPDGLETLNFANPGLVARVHRAYLKSGARVLLTNTFQLLSGKLADTMRDHELTSIGMAAVRSARLFAGQRRFILLDVGPFRGDQPSWAGPAIVTIASAEKVDAILMETCTSIVHTAQVVTRTLCGRLHELNLPLLVSWAFRRATNGALSTYAADLPEGCARASLEFAPAALGINCGTDIRLPELLEILDRYRSVTDLPLFVRPNAGTPKQTDGQWVYPETPESMAAWLPELFKAGVVMVGGCCGTTPAHIAAFRKVVDEWNAAHGRSEAES